MAIPSLDAAEVARRMDVGAAADALEAALAGGLDPEADAPRGVLEIGGGRSLMTMPSAAGEAVAVKVLSLGGEPRVQGVCVVFDPVSLAPRALVDGIALTNLRTPAVALVALRRLVRPGPLRVVVFGRGPQGAGHADAVATLGEVVSLAVFGRDADRDEVAAAVAAADVVCCCTTAREPVFDGALVADHAVVVAVGSHEPQVAELDAGLMRRAAVVVESRASALREAGDVIAAGLAPDRLTTLAELVAGASLPDDRPRVVKTTGMSWEDAVVAAALVGP